MNPAEVLLAIVLVCFVLTISGAEQTKANDLQNANRNLARRKRFILINNNKCDNHQGTVNDLRNQLCSRKRAKARAEANCRRQKSVIRKKIADASRDCAIKVQGVSATNEESLNKLRRETEELTHEKAQLQKANWKLRSELDDVTDELNRVKSKQEDMRRDLENGRKMDDNLQKTIDSLRENGADSNAGDQFSAAAGSSGQSQVAHLQQHLAQLKERAKAMLAELVQLRKQDWDSTQTLSRLQSEIDSYRKAAMSEKTKQLQECENPPARKRPPAPQSVGPLKDLYINLMKKLETMEAQVAEHQIMGCSSIVIVTKEAKPDQCGNHEAALKLCEEQRVAHKSEVAAAKKDMENCEQQILYLRQLIRETRRKQDAPLQTLRTRLTLVRTNADKCRHVLSDVKTRLGHMVEATVQVETFSAES